MKKILLTTMLAAVSAMAISASRIGPVSTYGELKASGNKLVGSCPDYANTAVQVKGMSLFWSSGADSSTVFYNEAAINHMVKDMNIEVIRFAMGVKNDFDKGRGYITGGEDLQKAMLMNVVNAAIDNDIYVIIDWHIESAEGYTSDAVKFFEYAAQKYGSYNNVIFEVWNEPTGGWDAVKNHANQVIPAIRKYSDNLILIGSTSWSSNPAECAGSFSDSNYGCTLHFYAATHAAGGDKSQSAQTAMGKNVPVFVTEWGTVSADGNGGANQSASQAWIDWMNQNKISWANWSASAVNEGSAAFNKLNIDAGLSYSASGNMVKGWMNKNASYKDCHLQNGNASSSDGYSKGVADGEMTDIIDDMEDGDRYAYSGGFWSAFTDANESGDNGVGKSSITNGTWENDFGKTVYDVLMPSDGGKNTSKYMVGLKGIKLAQGTYEYAPYVALGLNLTKDTTNIDLGKCNAISYKYKGARHQFRVETSLVTNWNFHYVEKDAVDDWKEVELSWEQFKQEDWGDNDKHFNLKTGMDKVNRFGWFIKGALDVPDAQNQPKYDYLYVDDVRCDGVSIKAISTLATPASSSSGPTSSPNGSSSSVGPGPAGSSSSGVGPATQVITVVDIDDVEDANEVLKIGGTWYAYTDKDAGGLSKITNTFDDALPGYVVVFPGTEDPTNGTAGFVGLKGVSWDQGTYAETPFVALGLNTNADTSLGVDMSQCNAISYRYKGMAHTFKVQDGNVTDYAYHQRKVDSSSVWTEIVIEKKFIKQPVWGEAVDFNWAATKKMAWEVLGGKNTPEYQPDPNFNYLYIDDLKCVNVSTDAIKGNRIVSNSIRLGVQGSNLSVNLDKAGSVRVQVFDMMGHVVENVSASMNAGANTVSLEKLGKGSYVVRVVRGSEVKAARVTIR